MITVRNGSSVRVKIYTTASGGRDGQGVRHEVRWTDNHGVIRRKKHSVLAQAKKEAETIAANLASGHHHSELSPSDLASFRAATDILGGYGVKFEAVASQYSECQALLRTALAGQSTPVPSIQQLATFWLENREAALVDMPVSKAVDTLLESKKGQGISDRWYGSIKSQLTKFAHDNPVNVSGIDAPLVRGWAYGLPLAAKTRNNHLNAVKQLFNQPEFRAHRSRQAVLDIPEVMEGEGNKLLWLPEEFRKLLNAAPAHLLPVLILGGFTKMRSCEIMQVESSNIRLKEKRILLRVGQAKTRRWRVIQINDCAVAWLKTCQLPVGKVWRWESQKFNADLRELAAACKLEWRPNAMRRSAFTYDQICNPDLAGAARDGGNSPKVLENEYLNLLGVTLKTAKAWFALRPKTQAEKAVIISMPVAGVTKISPPPVPPEPQKAEFQGK